MRREQRGALLLTGTIPMDPEANEHAWVHWNHSRTLAPLPFRGGHLIELIMDNRSGGAYAVLVTLLAEYDIKNEEIDPKELIDTIAELKEKISWPVNSRSNPELRTRVRSVYEGLGFVTLAGGWDLGIVKNSSLDVERDGEVIGKLIVTTVEASTAAADIVPDSVASGDAVRPGDQVVAEKKNK